MKQQKTRKIKQLPSIQGSEWDPVHNEPHPRQEKDQMPKGDSIPNKSESKAVLRMKIEKLLQRREAASNDAWLELGAEARNMLLVLLEDVSFLQQPELRHRLIATIGQLDLPGAVPDLGNILINKSEDALTQTYAANALGRMSDQRIVSYLGQAITNKDPMVRRQVATALGKIKNPDSIPYLLRLQEDSSKDVTSVATKNLAEYQKQSKIKLKIKSTGKKKQERKTKLRPKEE